MTKKKISAIDKFMSLSDQEKERIYRQFDREFVADEAKPLTPNQQKLWRKAKGKPGRPHVGAGSQRVLITIETRLLAKADAFAKKRKKSRSRLIAECLQAVMGKNDK